MLRRKNGSKAKARDRKALIFIEDGSFNYDNRVKREASALVDAGWDVTVVCPKFPEDPFYWVEHARLRVYSYPKPNTVGALGHVFEQGMSLFFGSILSSWVSVRHGFTVIQGCNPLDVVWAIALPHKLFGKKYIFDQHDLCPELYLSREDAREGDLFYKVLKVMEGCSYKVADVTIATNESYKDTAVERGGKSRDEVFVVRNGPDLRRMRKADPRQNLVQPGETLVGYLGNMNEQDGVELLIQAAEVIIKGKGRDDVRFILVGEGNARPAIVAEAERRGISDKVSFTGRIPDDDMLAILNACDICVQPDPLNPLNDKSTMNKVMEYMALEKPVVAFDLKETRVSAGNAALYARPNEVSDFADKIVQLVDDPAQRREMARLGKQRVDEFLSWENSIPNLLAAYEHAIRV